MAQFGGHRRIRERLALIDHLDGLFRLPGRLDPANKQ